MRTKHQKPTPPQQLEDLLKANALRRLEGGPSSSPKRAKVKQPSKQNGKRKK